MSIRKTMASVPLAAACLFASTSSLADVTLGESNGWEFYSTGRIQAFVSYANGEGYPTVTDRYGNTVRLDAGGLFGLDAQREKDPDDPNDRGTISSMRVKSGFIGNVLGFGLRRQIDDQTTLRAFTALTAVIESEARRKYRPVFPDVREGYFRLESGWGALTVGRHLTLFSRGTTEINYLYAHGYGLGYPGSVDGTGPSAGHIGFGVLANGFAAGMMYATPVLGGLQLSVGLYDPNSLVGRNWERTQWVRPEAELTYDVKLGTSGAIKLFGNGGWQKVYFNDDTRSDSVWGAAYGGRFEFGPVRLGLAGHYGKGLGLNYALDPSDATTRPPDLGAELRVFDGYYAQSQFVFGKLAVSAGVGVTRVHRHELDRVDTVDGDSDPTTPAADDDGTPGEPDPPGYTIVKQQLGISAGVVYHVFDYLHLNVDYFRARWDWYSGVAENGFTWHSGTSQTVNFINVGATVDW